MTNTIKKNKFICCSFILNGLYFEYSGDIKVCGQVCHLGGDNIVLGNITNFNTEEINIKRKELIEYFKSGKIHPKCEGCIELQEFDIPKVFPKLKSFIIQHWTKCNSNCIYCFTNKNKKQFYQKETYEVYPILKEMIEKKMLYKNGLANISGGEVSCLKEFEKIVKLLNKLNYFIIVKTSGVEFEKIIAKGLKEGSTHIVISVDAGSKIVHEQIKQVKTYDKVWNNIKKYVKYQLFDYLVQLQYIIIPNINDTEEEINLWLEKCKQVNVKYVILEIDANYFEPNRDNIAPYIIELFHKTRKKAEEMGLSFSTANRATTMLTKGKYADPFWEQYKYSDGKYYDIFFKNNKK